MEISAGQVKTCVKRPVWDDDMQTGAYRCKWRYELGD